MGSEGLMCPVAMGKQNAKRRGLSPFVMAHGEAHGEVLNRLNRLNRFHCS